ncbi:hypothetical protein K474DRAFT_924100 [Panus rudis PR-1116 ss-1]|nr:hypothetical protein K474DRAFT_924100 [Panus rudis PR-1116 ss-1]
MSLCGRYICVSLLAIGIEYPCNLHSSRPLINRSKVCPLSRRHEGRTRRLPYLHNLCTKLVLGLVSFGFLIAPLGRTNDFLRCWLYGLGDLVLLSLTEMSATLYAFNLKASSLPTVRIQGALCKPAAPTVYHGSISLFYVDRRPFVSLEGEYERQSVLWVRSPSVIWDLHHIRKSSYSVTNTRPKAVNQGITRIRASVSWPAFCSAHLSSVSINDYPNMSTREPMDVSLIKSRLIVFAQLSIASSLLSGLALEAQLSTALFRFTIVLWL